MLPDADTTAAPHPQMVRPSRRRPGALATLYARSSIPARLMLLVLILFIPFTALLVHSIRSMGRTTEAALEQGLLYSSRAIAAAVDAELRTYTGIATALAQSPDLASGDLAAFERDARRATAGFSGVYVVYADAAGRQLINTAATGPLVAMRTAEGLANQHAALEAGSAVSDIFIGVATHNAVVTIDAPVIADGRPIGSVAVAVNAETFRSLLSAQRLPEDWLSGIIDRSGHYIARQPVGNTEVGQPASQGWRGSAGHEGLFRFDSIEGDPVINANTVSAVSGWTIGVGVRRAQLDAALNQTYRTAAVSGVVVATLSLLAAILIAWSIARPLAELRATADRITASSEIDIRHSPPEIAALWRELKRAATRRDQTEQAQRRVTLELAAARDAAARTAEQLGLAATTGRLGTFVWDIKANRNEWSPQLEELHGLAPGTFGGTYGAWTKLVHPDDLAAAERAGAEALASGTLHGEWRAVLPNGTTRWLEARGHVFGDADGAPDRMVGVNIDISERKAAETQKELLLNELAHRVKNTLTVVLSIARQTLPRHDAPIGAFVDRLHSLSAAHDSLMKNDWRGAMIAELIEAQVSPFMGDPIKQLKLEGEDLLLPVGCVTQLGMALHELTCNASKYGSLSVPGGMLTVTWRRLPSGNIAVTWTERGGPPATPPATTGFGSRLIERSVLNLERHYGPEGFSCAFEMQV